MRILSIDPGTINCGYAVIEKAHDKVQLINFGVITNKTSSTLPYRIKKTYDTLHDIVSEDDNITHIAIETPFYSRNLQTFLKLGYIRGIIYLISQQLGCDIIEFSPCEVKRIVAGRGNAKKQDVAMAIRLLFPEIGQNVKDDITDAIAVGVSALWKK